MGENVASDLRSFVIFAGYSSFLITYNWLVFTLPTMAKSENGGNFSWPEKVGPYNDTDHKTYIQYSFLMKGKRKLLVLHCIIY